MSDLLLLLNQILSFFLKITIFITSKPVAMETSGHFEKLMPLSNLLFGPLFKYHKFIQICDYAFPRFFGALRELLLISQIHQYFLLKKCEKLLHCISFFSTNNISVFGYQVVKINELTS